MRSSMTKRQLVVGWILAGWIVGGWTAMALRLAEEGKTSASIVVSPNAPPSVQYAAEELRDFLFEVTGARFPVSHEKAREGMNILVGPGAARLVDPSFSTDDLEDEGIAIKTVGNNLILAGGDPRGTLYAVYTFLEDQVGCRWWTASASTIPSTATLEIPDLDIRHVPSIKYRDTDNPDVSDPDFSVRNKYNGHHAPLFIDNSFSNIQDDQRRGGRKLAFIRSDKWHCHGFWTLIEPEVYFQDHPEWYALINGVRTHVAPDYILSSLCLTNEELQKEVVNNAKLALRWNPHATMMSIAQPDDGGPQNRCECGPCMAMEAAGTPSDLMVWFVNRVTAELVKMYPELVVTTLAYHYTQAPPKNHVPHEQIAVRLSTIKCSFRVPMSDERNRMLRDDLEGWGKISNRVHIWDYVDNFTYPIPHPNLRVLGPNVRYYAENGVTGIFNEVFPRRGWPGFSELRLWLLGKLMWDPYVDDQALIEDFVQGYYGPAAEHILAYLELIHDAVEQTDDHLGLSSRPGAEFQTFLMLNEAWGHMQQAEQAVVDESKLRVRVRLQWVPVLFEFMYEWDRLKREAEAAGIAWPFEGTQKDLHGRVAKMAGEHGLDFGEQASPFAF